MTDIKEALEAAMTQHENEQKEEQIPEVEAQATEEVKEEVTDDTGTGEGIEDRAADTETGETVESTETKADSPKFLPAEEETGETEETKDTGDQSESVEPGPIAWRAAAKQHWGKLPAEVRQEVARREKDISQGLRDSADARRFQEQFTQEVQPYEPLMRASGVDPMTATKNLWQMAATLQTGNVQQKAGLVAQIIQQNGIDLQTLDGILAGQVAPQGGQGQDPAIAQMIQRELAPVRQFMGSIQEARQQREQQTAQTAEEEIQTFAADEQNVFFEDLREDMADMMDLANQRGRKMSLKQAYDRALAMRPELLEATQHLRDQTTSGETAQTLQRKKRAAASVRSAPAPKNSTKPTDMRGQIEEAINLHSGNVN